MARFMVKASEFKNVCKAVNDRQLAELKKEIIEILKKQDEKDVKKAIDYFNSQEEHYTHLEKSLISGKWIQKAGYGVGTVRIWKGKKYKKIAPGKWARVFDKEGRGTNIAIGKLIARVQKIDNIEDLMAFVMQNKQRFVDENGIDLPVLDKLRAAVDAKNNGDIGSKETAKPAESTTTAELINKNKDKIDKYGIDIYKDEISNTTPKALKNMDEKELKDFINFTEYLKNENEKIHDNAQNQNEKNKAWMSAAHSEQLNRMAKNRLKAVIAQNEPIKNFNTEVANSVDIENFKKELDDSYNSEFRVASRLSEGDTDYSEGAIKFDKLVKNDKGAKDFIEKISNTNVDEIDSSLYKTVVMDLLEKKGFFKESEAEKTQNRSEAMKGNQNARKFGAEWEEKRKEIQGKLTENTDKLLEDNDNAKDVYEKLQNHLNKRKADAELYRKYLGNQEEPEDVKDFRKWCDDVIEQYRKEVTNTPSKEIISKWEETARNTPTEKLEEVYNGKQKIDYSNEYENYIDSTIINTFAKDKDLIFPQPYTMLKDIATRKFDNSDKIRLEVIKKELETRKKSPVEEKKETPKEEKTEKIYSVDNSGKVVSFDELQPIASNKSVGENEVQLPYSKDLANEIESLKDCVVPKWDNREFMKHVYYEDGKLITTDARRMKFIEVGELEGIPDGSYVDITTDKSGINIKKIDLDARFPNYKKVIPDNLNQSATLDTKLVKDKIKEMQKDGAISRKGSNIVQLEFRDGKVFIDDTAVGEAKDIKMKYGEGWGPARNDTNYMAINADYLVNALSGKKSVLQIGERADKAVVINTGSSSNILMPMSGSDKKMDYGQGRQAKKDANDKKAEERKKNKDYNFELLKDVREGKLTSSQVEKVAESIDDRLSSFTDEELQREWARLNYDIDKGFEKKALKSVNDIIDNKTHLSGYAAIAYSMLKERHPEIREKLATELEKRGISVKKSLFDDFVMDMFIDEDKEEIKEEKEEESLFNDYSAEQPDLFNSTEMKVQEAFNRCGCCL